MGSDDRRAAARRPRSGQRTVTPRTPSEATQPPRAHVSRTRVASVNQKMVDRMVKLRQQGFSYEEIGHQVGCSERTARRHTKGVSPRLVHPSDPRRIDLLNWCSANIFAIRDRLELNLRETDLAMKKAREEVSKLDPQTKERIERDREMRIDFLFNVVFPSAVPEIQSMRFIERIEREFGPLNKDPEITD